MIMLDRVNLLRRAIITQVDIMKGPSITTSHSSKRQSTRSNSAGEKKGHRRLIEFNLN